MNEKTMSVQMNAASAESPEQSIYIGCERAYGVVHFSFRENWLVVFYDCTSIWCDATVLLQWEWKKSQAQFPSTVRRDDHSILFLRFHAISIFERMFSDTFNWGRPLACLLACLFAQNNIISFFDCYMGINCCCALPNVGWYHTGAFYFMLPHNDYYMLRGGADTIAFFSPVFLCFTLSMPLFYGLIWPFHVWHNRISVRTVDLLTVCVGATHELINFNEDEDDKTTKITNVYVGAGGISLAVAGVLVRNNFSEATLYVSLLWCHVSFRFIHLLSLFVSSSFAIHTIHVTQLSHNIPNMSLTLTLSLCASLLLLLSTFFYHIIS